MHWRKFGAGIAAAGALGGGALYGADQAQNPYDDKGTHYELPVQTDFQQGERVEIAKDEPRIDLVGWNDEYRISVKPQFPPSFGADRAQKIQAERPLLSKQMQFRTGTVTAFVEPKEARANEFDIDFTLESKPDTNVFEYRIEGAEEFDFFYQPELTEEEIAEGAERPENVVGSYAVYHKTKANHRIGSTNYATGKAFHIYRPKAIDANGAEVWAELSYLDGVLAVAVPQKFLEDAVYPVVVDPTFGYTTSGASSIIIGYIIKAQYHQILEDGTLDSISAYTSVAANTATTRMGIYNYVGSGDAGTIVAATEDGVTSASSPTLITLDALTPQSLTNSTNYFLAIWMGGDSPLSGSAARLYYDSGGTAGHSFSETHLNAFLGSSGTWTSPDASTGVDEVSVWVWGGGAAGGGRTSNGGGGGGGGGAFASSTVAITPETGYAYNAGLGVSGGTGTGTNGNPSTFDSTVVVAAGGTGGGGGASSSGGAGGTTAASTGDTKIAGGNGGNGGGSGTAGGGGGEGACTFGGVADNGDNASGSTGGAGGSGCSGGDGGAGRGSSQGAGSGSTFTTGAGGGGAYRTSSNQNGGAGGRGAVYILPFYNTLPENILTETQTTAELNLSIYATYTAAGGGAEEPPADSGIIWFE